MLFIFIVLKGCGLTEIHVIRSKARNLKINQELFVHMLFRKMYAITVVMYAKRRMCKLTMALISEPRHWCSATPLELKYIYMASSNEEEFCKFLLLSLSHIIQNLTVQHLWGMTQSFSGLSPNKL